MPYIKYIARHTRPGIAKAAVLCCIASAAFAQSRHAPDSPAFFEEHIRPIFVDNCISCHGPDKQENNLRLDTQQAIHSGGKTGPALVPHKSAESLIIKVVRRQGPEMPPNKPLDDKDVALLQQWIDAGAFWPNHSASINPASLEGPEWWAFQPLTKPQIPNVAGDNWSENPIDRFVYARLQEEGLNPAPQATAQELVRRVYFDLIGLPPSPEEMQAFLNDTAPDPWENLIDKLLADPRYGEHWARFWLDLVRYAESDGWNKDSYRPHIWRYRDYVVQSFNEDKPYPQFVREQLAGDEMPGDDPNQIIATGYLRLGIYEYNQRDARNHWNDIMNEITDVTGDVFFGLSMSCSRCHNHKFDPIPQTDYFSLRAFFEPLVWTDDVPGATEAEQAAYEEKLAEWERATAEIQAEIDALCEPYYEKKWADTVDKFPLEIQACFNKPVEERTSWEHQMAYLVTRQFYEEGQPALQPMTEEDKKKLEELEKKLAEHNGIKPQPLPTVMSVVDFQGKISPTVIPDREEVSPIRPAFLTALSDDEADAKPLVPDIPDSTGRRTALAQWIGSDRNPLTTRLMVNRIWQQHFGEGIVPSASDFGRLGQPPTHPELLDWLTNQFIENDWSMKHLHKLVLMSATWRQSSNHPQAEKYLEQDPAESLLWRARVRRLKAESVRDAMLAVSGELDPKVGGPSVDADEPRRALYVKVRRNSPDPLLSAFDAANGLTSIAERTNTTTPTQALLMLNGDYALGRAKKLAERILNMDTPLPTKKLEHLFLLTWNRKPTTEELTQALNFIASTNEANDYTINNEKLIDLCHILLNSNEFLYVD